MSTEPILLSILVPSIPSRLSMLTALVSRLQSKIGGLPVQVLCLIDNKKISIGEKRDALVQISQSKFVAFCDDDDLISDEYIPEIVTAIQNNPDADVITFRQHAVINGKKFSVNFGLGYENEQARKIYDGEYVDIKRPPYHICAWKTSLAKQFHFPPLQDGEDWAWVQQILPHAKNEVHIDKVLHTYRYDSNITEAK